MVFALLLAMAALGLSMIFGTTGLTNFAHGELITFGALVAYGVDSLPGTFTIGGTNVTVAVADRGRRDRRRPASAGSTTGRCGGRCGTAAPAWSR